MRWMGLHVLAGALAALWTTAAGAGVARVAGDAPDPLAIGLTMIVVGALEGALVGGLQAVAVRAGGLFVRRTVLGFALAWVFGALFSALEPDGMLPRSTLLATAAVAGAGFGALVGRLQEDALRVAGRVPGGPWTLHAAAAWAASFVIGAASSDLLPTGLVGAQALAQVTLGGALGGLALGAVLHPARPA